MKCKFCQQDCTTTHHDGVYINEIKIWQCNKHQFLVKHYLDIIQEDYDLNPVYLWIDTIIFVNYKNNFFRAHFYPTSFELEKITEFTDYGSIKHETIFRLKSHPDINPENILNKIKLYLPFI